MLNKIELYLQLIFEICPLNDDISDEVNAEGKSVMHGGPGE